MTTTATTFVSLNPISKGKQNKLHHGPWMPKGPSLCLSAPISDDKAQAASPRRTFGSRSHRHLYIRYPVVCLLPTDETTLPLAWLKINPIHVQKVGRLDCIIIVLWDFFFLVCLALSAARCPGDTKCGISCVCLRVCFLFFFSFGRRVEFCDH